MKTILSYKTNKQIGAFDIINFLFLSLLALITLFPFYYVLIISFAKYEDIVTHLIYIFPSSFDLSAYKIIFSAKYIFNSLLVSTFVTVAGTLLSMLISVSAAFTLSRKQLWGRKIMYAFVLVTLFFSGGMIPYYLTVKATGLINNILVMIIPVLINSFYLLLLKNFFEDMPVSLEESAKIDGANDICILAKIIVPTAAPVIATVSLFYAVDRWNEYYNALLFISDTKLYPLQIVLREVLLNFSSLKANAIGEEIAANKNFVYSKSMQMAIVTVATIPILCVYPFLQRHFNKGIMLGAVKG